MFDRLTQQLLSSLPQQGLKTAMLIRLQQSCRQDPEQAAAKVDEAASCRRNYIRPEP
jgi:hypothetical protein